MVTIICVVAREKEGRQRQKRQDYFSINKPSELAGVVGVF